MMDSSVIKSFVGVPVNALPIPMPIEHRSRNDDDDSCSLLSSSGGQDRLVPDVSDRLHNKSLPPDDEGSGFHQEDIEEFGSYENRALINQKLMALPSEMLAEFVEYMKRIAPNMFHDPNEIEIDFETLDPFLLFQVRIFVEQALQKLATPVKKTSPPRHRKDPYGHRFCSSCRTKNTPTWRESEGTILCNACGLRLIKLGFRCPNKACGYVPHSSEIPKPCPHCHNYFASSSF